MQDYLFYGLYGGVLIEAIDLAVSAARLEMYNAIKYLSVDKRAEIPSNVYDSICFYLLPNDKLIKLTKNLPITYLFDRKIKIMLKNKTYGGKPVLDVLEEIKNTKWEDIKNLPISALKRRSEF
jgi:hypothetical protein